MVSKNKNKDTYTQVLIACILGALSILLGAFSAHGLEALVKTGHLLKHYLDVFEKAVRYQMYHSIVLFVCALFNLFYKNDVFRLSFWIIFSGIILFSGSLYWIALQDIIHIAFPRFLFWITPLGGMLMVVGWLWMIRDIYLFKRTS